MKTERQDTFNPRKKHILIPLEIFLFLFCKNVIKTDYLAFSFTRCIYLTFWETKSCRFVNRQKPYERIPNFSGMWLLTFNL